MKRRDFFKNMVGSGIAAMVLPNVQWIGEESKAVTLLDDGAGLRFFDDWVLNITHEQSWFIAEGGLPMTAPGKQGAELIVNFPPNEWEAYRKAFNDCKLVECKLRRPGEDYYMLGDFYVTTISYKGSKHSAVLELSGSLCINVD